MKKIITCFAFVLLLTLLAGCGRSKEEVLVVGRWGGNESETAAFAEILRQFTEETGIKVVEKVYTDYTTQLKADLIAGTAPDVFYVDAFMAPFFIEQGTLLPIDFDAVDGEQFYEPLINAFKSNGNLYAVPKDYSTLALYYNKELVDGSTIPTTFEELFGGDFLTNLNSTLPQGSIAMTYNQDLARDLFMAEAGGRSITNNTDNATLESVVKNLQLQYDAAVAGKIKTPADLGTGWNGEAFGTGKTAIMIEGNWVIGYLNDEFPDIEFGVLEVPTFKGERGTMVFTVGYGINASTKLADDALRFVQFATNQGMTIFSERTGVLPAREDIAIELDVSNDPLKAPHVAGADYATPWQKGATLETINTEYQNYIPSVISGQRTLLEALRKIDQEANNIINASR